MSEQLFRQLLIRDNLGVHISGSTEETYNRRMEPWTQGAIDTFREMYRGDQVALDWLDENVRPGSNEPAPGTLDHHPLRMANPVDHRGNGFDDRRITIQTGPAGYEAFSRAIEEEARQYLRERPLEDPGHSHNPLTSHSFEMYDITNNNPMMRMSDIAKPKAGGQRVEITSETNVEELLKEMLGL